MAIRLFSLVTDSLIYGTAFGYLNYLIHAPDPLEPHDTWRKVMEDPGGPISWVARNYPPSFARRWLLMRKVRQDARLGIAEHYDVSNDFFKLFLDQKYMFYTCADFIHGTETLEEAQTKKADYILGLIDPHPGERILDLGCGWGAMLKRIYEATDDKENLFGYTLSEEQVAYNEAHHHFHVEFRNFVTTDYPAAHFDKIYSIGSWEHVRPPEIPPLLAKLYRALKPGGRLVQHFLCRLSDPLPAAATVSQLFFPGSVNSSFKFHRQSFEQAGFRIIHLSVHDYRDTLKAWFDRLAARRDEAIALVGISTYNRYLVFFASAYRYFNEVTGQLFRFVLQKPAT
jgi:cyclopropane-fatty-acyl-phospholipid synthase